MHFRKSVLSLAVLLLATVPLALAQGTYTQIDVPGAVETYAQGVNSSGAVAGYYYNNSNQFGFFLSGGTYTTIDVRSAEYTQALGINDLDQVVGSTIIPDGAFVYDAQTQTVTIIACNNYWAVYTYAAAINNKGTVVGTANGYTNVGYELPSSSAHCRAVAGPGGSKGSPYGIDTAGDLLMSVYDYHSGSYAYFLLNGQKYRELTIPGAPNAAVAGINPQGTALVGNYQPSPGTYAGFLYQNKVLTTLEFPGAVGTFATGVSAVGEVVGYFYSSGTVHGFTWTPPADAAKK